MDTKHQLQREIEAFCRKHSLSGARFGVMAVGDASFWHKFIRGRVPRVDTVDRIRAFMRDYGREGERHAEGTGNAIARGEADGGAG